MSSSILCFARFVLESNKMKEAGRPRSFLPNKEGRVSLSGVDELDDHEIRDVGQCVADERRKSLYGWECLCRESVTNLGLALEETEDVCNAPHANIINWPASQEDARGVRVKLVRLATLHTA